jgi:putative serine protease PepD
VDRNGAIGSPDQDDRFRGAPWDVNRGGTDGERRDGSADGRAGGRTSWDARDGGADLFSEIRPDDGDGLGQVPWDAGLLGDSRSGRVTDTAAPDGQEAGTAGRDGTDAAGPFGDRTPDDLFGERSGAWGVVVPLEGRHERDAGRSAAPRRGAPRPVDRSGSHDAVDGPDGRRTGADGPAGVAWPPLSGESGQAGHSRETRRDDPPEDPRRSFPGGTGSDAPAEDVADLDPFVQLDEPFDGDPPDRPGPRPRPGSRPPQGWDGPEQTTRPYRPGEHVNGRRAVVAMDEHLRGRHRGPGSTRPERSVDAEGVTSRLAVPEQDRIEQDRNGRDPGASILEGLVDPESAVPSQAGPRHAEPRAGELGLPEARRPADPEGPPRRRPGRTEVSGRPDDAEDADADDPSASDIEPVTTAMSTVERKRGRRPAPPPEGGIEPMTTALPRTRPTVPDGSERELGDVAAPLTEPITVPAGPRPAPADDHEFLDEPEPRPEPVRPAPRQRSEAPPRRRRWLVLAGAGAAAALVVGAAGGAVGYSLARTDGTPVAPATSAPGAVASGAGAVEQVAAKVLPSVVQLRADGAADTTTGSGVVLSPDGLVLTNNHVVELAGNRPIAVLLQDGRTAVASVVGRDPNSDLAVVRIADVTGLTPAELGDSASIAVGQQVVAVGSPLGLSGTVTTGVVSALDRAVTVGPAQGARTSTVLNAIQTDAAINPGNSGGPLVDMAGRVIGINSAIATTGPKDGSIGVGFAVPINQAKRVADELERTGKATRASLGLTAASDPRRSGAVVKTLVADGPGAAAGIKVGDLIVRVDDRPVATGDDLQAVVGSRAPGEVVRIQLSDRTVEATLGTSG